jgi:hypothetical protein
MFLLLPEIRRRNVLQIAFPRLAQWAAFLRRFAADLWGLSKNCLSLGFIWAGDNVAFWCWVYRFPLFRKERGRMGHPQCKWYKSPASRLLGGFFHA